MYLNCDGNFFTTNNGNIRCSGTITSVPDSSIETIFEALSIADAVEISGVILMLWAVAYSIKFLIDFVKNSGFGRF